MNRLFCYVTTADWKADWRANVETGSGTGGTNEKAQLEKNITKKGVMLSSLNITSIKQKVKQ